MHGSNLCGDIRQFLHELPLSFYFPTLFACVERASEPWYTSKQGETEAASERQKQKKHSMDPLQVMQEARKRMHSHTQPAAVSSLSYITDIPHQSAGACTAEEGMAEEPRTKRHKGSKEVSTSPVPGAMHGLCNIVVSPLRVLTP